MDLQRLADDVADRHARVERGVRILKDDLHLFAQRTQFRPAQRGDVAAVERDAAGGRVGEPQDARARGRLARARFADQAQRLAATDVEVDAVDRFDVADALLQQAGGDRKVLLEVADDDQVRARHDSASRPPCGGAFSHVERAQLLGPLVVEEAARHVPAAEIVERDRLVADRHLVAAAGRERAAGRHAQQVRRLALDRNEPLAGRVEPRQRLQQAHRVGHLGPVEDVVGASVLDHIAAVHHQHVLHVSATTPEVVRDQDDRRAQALLHLVHQLDDLGLNRDVEGRRRLVGDQHRRIAARAMAIITR